MDRDITRKTWGSIVIVLQNQRGDSVIAVDICHKIIYHRYEGKERLEVGLKNSLSNRFKLTKGTSMRSVQLQQYFGILGNTTVASDVLEGTYVAP